MSQKQQHLLSNSTVLEACKALQSQISFAENMLSQCATHGVSGGASHFWETSRHNAAAALTELTGI